MHDAGLRRDMVARRHDISPSHKDRVDGRAAAVQTVSLTEGEDPSTAVIRAISAVSDRPPSEMEPLYSTIDLEALDALFRRGRDGIPRLAGHFRFTHEGYGVELTDDQVIIRDSHDK